MKMYVPISNGSLRFPPNYSFCPNVALVSIVERRLAECAELLVNC
jgi:hypothetical protein